MIKELVIISGKGGAGKTSITASLAALAGRSVIVDADVDAADMYLVIPPAGSKKYDFEGGYAAIIHPDLCTGCGSCRELCQFSAISPDFEIDPILCEGCGVCAHFCPEKAIEMKQKTCGNWFMSETRFGSMFHARLFPGEENSGLLVSRLREEARERAENDGVPLIITDGPPGIGCPVIASITGSSLVLANAEPTVSGVHDVKRAWELASFFRTPMLLCINKSGLNPEMEEDLKKWAAERDIPLAGEIPYDREFTSAMMSGRTLVEFTDADSETALALKKVWNNIGKALVRTDHGLK
jgi:MinD superfamily P-loop ATPase